MRWTNVVVILTCIASSYGVKLNPILIPEEVQTLLQLVYSYLPTLRTGTDSKVGLGFRLGRNADVQVVLELGPQTTTGTNNDKRRQVGPNSPAVPKIERNFTVNSFNESIENNEIPQEEQNFTMNNKISDLPNSVKSIPEGRRKKEIILTQATSNSTKTSTSNNNSTQTGVGRLITAIISLFN